MEKCECETKFYGKNDLGENINTSISNDRYRDVAEEIISIIKEYKLDSLDLKNQIIEILQRRFNVDKENVGKILMDDTTMFYLDNGHTFTIPMFGMLAFSGYRVKPIINDRCFPNYDIRNKYIGYTENGVFRKVNMFTRLIDGIKRDPNMVIISILTGYLVTRAILGI